MPLTLPTSAAAFMVQAGISGQDFRSCFLAGFHTAANVPPSYPLLCSKPSRGPHFTRRNCSTRLSRIPVHHCLDSLPPSLLRACFFAGMLPPPGSFQLAIFSPWNAFHADTYMAFSVTSFTSLLKCYLRRETFCEHPTWSCSACPHTPPLLSVPFPPLA